MRTLGLAKVNLPALQERIRQARRDLAELLALEQLVKKQKAAEGSNTR